MKRELMQSPIVDYAVHLGLSLGRHPVKAVRFPHPDKVLGGPSRSTRSSFPLGLRVVIPSIGVN